ncbi:MAG: hypothetical protein JST39_20380 [Bacteroidetes bacterium]|nr:hypothetical protein [Bacteroidota bacterium]
MLLKKNIPFKYIFGKIKYELCFIVLYTAFVAAVLKSYAPDFVIPLTVPAILGTVISLLLGFRSNQAYDRWWEARHIWGAVVNDSRTWARQILSFTEIEVEGDEVHQFRQRTVRRQMAWCYSLGQSLRQIPGTQGLERFISKKEQQSVSQYNNTPLALLEWHGRDIKLALEQGWINRYQQVELDRTLSRLCDNMGKCERIKNTVFPSTYSLYIHFSLMLFMGLLPFGLVEVFGFWAIPLTTGIAACFLLIEKMAIHLQDPFENKPTDTPVTTIARKIEIDLRQMLRDQEMPEEEKGRALFYVL